VNVLDLFSGIGGFSLGLERAGMRTVAFCEIDPYCQRILAKHWPNVPVFGDVRELTAQSLADANRGRQPKFTECNGQSITGQQASCGSDPVGCHVDVICGGFPCQDISVAGKGAGIAGERSGLWKEFGRIIGEVRPRYVIVENVAALLGRGFGVVLGDLAALGMCCEWHCIPASAVGAPHRRDRLWIVAYSISSELRDQSGRRNGSGWSYTPQLKHFGWWLTEPNVGRVAHGVPARVDRLRALGNAIVPQIAEIIGRAIMAIESNECVEPKG
jgi:DNA (cytosine-5)-methyltransferase 1